ncbi:Cys-tRNA(Pro) deacylase [Tessaracoccus palaemonis]|uniref:Cys-tRNA(Pro)/Cys-tRNA(Cys) deacylase n=1 Tax=Tessaracoccus palaemonis TaxID=2829499 RepID=A0ABX8SI87_9ACTN|nr:Cys-tRNA(Pro) deacylase [Tessaracoccus palaemonis]QXT61678.1 Cys-tRNA(Pro) deacylase [Tessaracoccus palaemonis]
MARRQQGTPALKALEAAGVEFVTHEYEHDPRADSFGLEAAEALGFPAARVFKTLLATNGQALVVGVVPVTGRLNLKSLAHAAGHKKLEMADPRLAERRTGMVVGGISPVGHQRRLPTVLDASAMAHDTILVSGGRRGLDVELAPGDLVRLTGATVADIAAG